MKEPRDWVQGQRSYLYPAVSTYYEEPLTLVRGEGMYLYDEAQQPYLDFFAGILTVNVGHGNPEVASRMCDQIRTLGHTSTLYVTGPQVKLAEKLAGLAPGRVRRSFFTNSGTEANETAVLSAQMHTGRQEIVALRHCYSGRSMLAMSVTAQNAWRVGGTHIAGIKHAHSPYCYRCAFGRSYPGCDLECARDVEELIQTTTSGAIAAFIAEPILGVGGFITPPPEYFQEVERIIREYGGLFIADEVQTGFARTGDRWFGIEHWGVEPDLITCAKGMANGAPIGATLATDEVAESWQGKTISTFGGNPVSSAASLATIEHIEEQNLLHNARKMGDRLRDGLEQLKEKYRAVGDVRGMGLMQGVEVVDEDGAPDSDCVDRIFEKTRQQGLLIGRGGLYNNVLRITPPLIAGADHIDEGLELLERAISAAGG